MDLPIEFSDVRDEARPLRDGTTEKVKRYQFYLGKFGPFIERIPLDVTDQTSELQRRVALLRSHLQAIHLQ